MEPEWMTVKLSEVEVWNFKDCDAVIHLAAAGVNPETGTWEGCFDTNVAASLRLWLKAAEAGVKRFVVCGSCFEYGLAAERYEFIPTTAALEPVGPYHSSKAAASVAAIGLGVDRGLEMAVLRPFHVFGEGEADYRFWPGLRHAATAGENFPMTPGEQVRDFMPVAEVAACFLDAAGIEAFSPGRPVVRNLGTGRPQTLIEFARYWWRRWDAKGALLPGALPYRENEIMRYVPDLQPSIIGRNE
jgi:nucleoside-diphosphate-sugar epimerase